MYQMYLSAFLSVFSLSLSLSPCLLCSFLSALSLSNSLCLARSHSLALSLYLFLLLFLFLLSLSRLALPLSVGEQQVMDTRYCATKEEMRRARWVMPCLPSTLRSQICYIDSGPLPPTLHVVLSFYLLSMCLAWKSSQGQPAQRAPNILRRGCNCSVSCLLMCHFGARCRSHTQR